MLSFAKAALLLLVFSLPFMKFHVVVGSRFATGTDLIFLVTVGALAIAVAKGEARLRWDPLYAVLLIYLGSMLASILAAENPQGAWLKLATQLYLLSLPLLASSLIGNISDLRAVMLAWLGGTAVTAAIGAITVLLFAVGVEQPLWGYALHEFGTLPPGNYPRIESTFDFPAMLCNYLTVSLLILLVAKHLKWVGEATFWLLLAAIGLTALVTLTPGLGGIFLALGLWGYWFLRGRAAGVALTAGIAVAAAFLLAATVTPIIHPSAPFLIHFPGIDREFAPSVRMMAWIDSATRFLHHPVLGAGLGADAANVRYVDPSGITHRLSDAHNVFLNVAVQCGLIGLVAILLLVAHVAKLASPRRVPRDRLIIAGLGLAWLDSFAYQGLTGSYEDARHLWLLLGLVIAATRLEQEHTISEGERPGAAIKALP